MFGTSGILSYSQLKFKGRIQNNMDGFRLVQKSPFFPLKVFLSWLDIQLNIKYTKCRQIHLVLNSAIQCYMTMMHFISDLSRNNDIKALVRTTLLSLMHIILCFMICIYLLNNSISVQTNIRVTMLGLSLRLLLSQF